MLVFDLPLALRESGAITKFNISANSANRDSVQMSVFGTIVPEISVPALTLPYAGQSLKVSSHAREPYEESTLGFKVDNRFMNWWTMWFWLNLQNDAYQSGYDRKNLGSHAKNYMRNYQTDFSVFALDEYNQRTMQFVYKMAFPTGIGRIEYDYKTPDEIVSGFTFAYSQLLVTPVTS